MNNIIRLMQFSELMYFKLSTIFKILIHELGRGVPFDEDKGEQSSLSSRRDFRVNQSSQATLKKEKKNL